MKTKIFVLVVSLLCIIGFAIVGCNQDDYENSYKYSSDLDVVYHTSLTRNSAFDFGDIDQGGPERAEINKWYPHEPNCCFLTVIMEAWIRMHGTDYFLNYNCHPNAAEYYEQLKTRFKNANPDWNVGDSISSTQFDDFIEDNCSYLSGTIIFSEIGTNAHDYFSKSSNRTKISAILVTKAGVSNNHMAPYNGYSTGAVNNVRFLGEDFIGNGRYKMNVDGESGWTIFGVVVKK